ncbi:MAG: acetylornithine deacetylase [Gammaproteobacteria bacterium]|nr:acetylornithine deacetylase [Gammaproteobacteria bacterium]
MLSKLAPMTAPVQNHRMPPKLRQMISELIGTPSISSVSPEFDSSNLAVCNLLASWLEDLDFRIDVRSVPGTHDKFNLIATRGDGPGGLVLAGHTDTVPFDEGKWQTDPFGAKERDQRIYGLGSADMKSFFALAIEAVRACLDRDPRQPLTLLATADEESSMSGARALAESGRLPGAYAVIGEPTGLRPVRAHKGITMDAVRLTGKAAHSSNPATGVNAIDGMHRVIASLIALRQQLAQRFHDERFDVPAPTLNLGHIQGGDNPNRVCAMCELHFDLRLLPGMHIDSSRREIQAAVTDSLVDTGLEIEFETLFEGVEALEVPENSKLLKACTRHTGKTPQVVGFATEAPFLAGMGLDTVVIGPGDIAQAHRPDEYLPLSAIAPTLHLLQTLIGQFCLEAA